MLRFLIWRMPENIGSLIACGKRGGSVSVMRSMTYSNCQRQPSYGCTAIFIIYGCSAINREVANRGLFACKPKCENVYSTVSLRISRSQ